MSLFRLDEEVLVDNFILSLREDINEVILLEMTAQEAKERDRRKIFF